MKLTDLMNGHKPDPKYEGWVTNDDYVLAVRCRHPPVPCAFRRILRPGTAQCPCNRD